MNNKFRYPLLLSAMMLAACGSDSDNNIVVNPGVGDDTPEQETQPPVAGVQYENFDLKTQLNDPLEGEVFFFLGRWYRCSENHPEFCDGGYKPDGDNKNLFTPDPKKHEMTVKVSDLARVRGKSINPQVAEGQFTLLDLMLYASEVRDDLEITMSDFDESIGTYRFTTSFDANGDGTFSLDDGAENFQSPNWYPRFTYTGGDFKREIGPPTLEAIYERPEEFLLRPNAEVRYEPFTPLMTERRAYIQAKEVQRLNDNDGKVVIAQLQVDLGDGNGYVTIAEDIEVDNYNLRPDLFNDGVYTIADALMTAHNDESENVDIGFTIWPTLGTNANVDAYAINSVQGKRAQGFNGWLLYSGEIESRSDFFSSKWRGGVPFTVDEVLADRNKFCPWVENMTAQQAQWCIEDYDNVFGGNMLHHMSDSWVINYPQEIVQLKMAAQNGLWRVQEFHYADGKYPWYDISKSVAPMDDSHFGWGIADCSQCHSIENVHVEGDSPLLPSTAEPYYCAQCHGSNGAPQGHGEEARCHWCHSKDKLMVNHGEVSRATRFGDIQCRDDISDANGNQVNGPCANANTQGMKVHDKADNVGPYYQGGSLTTTNSDWHMDSQFPDPYSCVTCHPNASMEASTSAH